jgi:hypothetical protein
VEPVPHVRLYRLATAAALVVAPAIFLADNLLHPEEFTRDHEAEQLAAIAEAYTRWQLAHFLGFLSAIVFAAAVLGLAFLVRGRRPGIGLVGGALALAGLLGLAGALALDGFTWGILGEVSARPEADAATVELALHDVQQSEWALPFYALALAWIAGLVVLAASAALEGAVPWWAAGLFCLGAVMVGAEAQIQDNAYFIASAAVLLAGGVALALPLARMSDAEFAGRR